MAPDVGPRAVATGQSAAYGRDGDWSGFTRESSSHVIGVETGAPWRARTAYAGTAVWP